jgi:dTMP kinase
MLVSFSGLDCAGKSTQIELLKGHIKDKGYNAEVIWSRGGYTPGVNFLKSLIRRDNRKPEERSEEERKAMVEREPRGGTLLLWLSIVDLIWYWGIIFRSKSLNKKIVICDRYYWDTYIDFKLRYPNVNFENWVSWKLLNKLYKKPDCDYCLTVTPEESMRRSSLKFEPFPETEEKRVKRLDEYMKFIKDGKWKYVIDCMRDIEVIQADIVAIFDKELK